jgi:hypothetical protein
MRSRIILGEEKLLIANDKFEQEILWNDISCISFYKLDCINQMKTFITLDFGFGEFVELHDEMVGWSEFINNIHNYIEIQDSNWKTKLEDAGPGGSVIKIFQR